MTPKEVANYLNLILFLFFYSSEDLLNAFIYRFLSITSVTKLSFYRELFSFLAITVKVADNFLYFSWNIFFPFSSFLRNWLIHICSIVILHMSRTESGLFQGCNWTGLGGVFVGFVCFHFVVVVRFFCLICFFPPVTTAPKPVLSFLYLHSFFCIWF